MYAMEKFGHVIAESELIEMFGFCKVHFDKSSRRVASNSGVVHLAKQDLFDESVRLLLSYKRSSLSSSGDANIRDFFKAEKWLK